MIRRDEHPNDTLSQISKPLSNRDADEPAQFDLLLMIGSNLAKNAPSCPVCQMNLLNPCLSVKSASQIIVPPSNRSGYAIHDSEMSDSANFSDSKSHFTIEKITLAIIKTKMKEIKKRVCYPAI